MKRFPALALLAFVPWLAGCGPDQPRQTVTGSVSFKGQPLNQGRIEFLPLDRQGSAQGAVIANGSFTIPADKGLLPGKYQVQVFSSDYVHTPPAGPIGTGPSVPAPKERVNVKYNTKSTLTADVKSGAANVFDFQVDG